MIEPSRAPTTVRALTYGWRWALGLAWFGVVAGFSVVSRSSRELGLPTWWLGPSSDPQPYVIVAMPFLVAAAVVALTFTRIHWTPWAAVGAGAILLLVGLGDVLGDYPRLGVVEVALAAAGTAVGAMSFTGRTRPAQDTPTPAEAGGTGETQAADADVALHEDDRTTGR